MSTQPVNSSLPVRRLPAGPLEEPRRLPGRDIPVLRGLSTPRRLARLGTVLASFSFVLVLGGLAGWKLLGTQLPDGAGDRGPWPLVLGAAFCIGLLGAGCGLVSLAFDTPARRQAFGALCVSLVAPLAVGILALALFFSTTSTSFL
jgi:hypothetical protein